MSALSTSCTARAVKASAGSGARYRVMNARNDSQATTKTEAAAKWRLARRRAARGVS